MRKALCIGVLVLSWMACRKENTGPRSDALRVPANFPAAPGHTDNPITKEGVALGRMLFYDRRLSGTNQVSCASCHHQELAFTDGAALGANGVSGRPLLRTAPALFNLAWANTGLFWDGGSTNLESQVFGPLSHADEMFQDLNELLRELKAVPAYVLAFRAAFGEDVTTAGLAKALAQFQRSLVSATSRYDRFRRREPGGVLDATEQEGMRLVAQHCQGCHAGELFSDFGYHNNGIDAGFDYTTEEGIYQGRSRITYNPADLGKFKTPSLRNVMLTAPYMHDGRFATMEAVLEHYTHGIKATATLDPALVNGIALSDNDTQAIIAFLKTLTDTAFINNEAQSDPFNH